MIFKYIKIVIIKDIWDFEGEKRKEKMQVQYFFDSFSRNLHFLLQCRLRDLIQNIVVCEFSSNALIRVCLPKVFV